MLSFGISGKFPQTENLVFCSLDDYSHLIWSCLKMCLSQLGTAVVQYSSGLYVCDKHQLFPIAVAVSLSPLRERDSRETSTIRNTFLTVYVLLINNCLNYESWPWIITTFDDPATGGPPAHSFCNFHSKQCGNGAEGGGESELSCISTT